MPNTDLSSAEIGIGMLALTIPLITLHLLAHRFREQYKLTRPIETLIGCTLIVLSMVWWFTAASRHPTYIMVLPSLVFMGSGFGMIRLFGHMGVIKETGQRWASTLFGTRTFSNHVGAAIGAIVIGFVLPATSMHVLSNDPQIAEQAALVAAWPLPSWSSPRPFLLRSKTSSSAMRIRTGISPKHRHLN